MAAALNPVGVDAMTSRDEMARKAYFLNLNQARPQGRKVPIEWWDTDAQTIECHRNVRVGPFSSLPKHMLVVFQRTP